MMHPSHYIFPTLTPRKVGGNIFSMQLVCLVDGHDSYKGFVCFCSYNPSRGGVTLQERV